MRKAPTKGAASVHELEQRLAEALERVKAMGEVLQEKDRALTEAHTQVTGTREQQTATSEILRLISSSPNDLQPVFDIIAERAAALTDAVYSAVYMIEGEWIHLHAWYSRGITNTDQFAASFPMLITSETLIAGALRTGTLANIGDMEDIRVPEAGRTLARTLGVRSTLAVPIRRDGHPIGAIGVNRREAHEFTPGEIALLQTFADQAVIAIENVRLFKELEARNRDLTASSEILGVIAGSPTDAQPVFAAIIRSAVRLCEGVFGGVFRVDGNMLHMVADYNLTPEVRTVYQQVFPMELTQDNRRNVSARAVIDRTVVHLSDIRQEPDFGISGRLSEALKFRAILSVPMVRDGSVIGAITVARAEAGAFSENQVELLGTFAAQAVIAIENVRLFTELQAKNAALSEALEQQTATADILRVISSSPTDLQPVFDAILRSGQRLLGARTTSVLRRLADQIHLAAFTSAGEAGDTAYASLFPMSLDDYRERYPFAMQDWVNGGVIHVPDVELDVRSPEIARRLARARGFRSVLQVPMRREGQVIGVLGITRSEPGAFAEDEIALAQTFADQAVIAIENVRLFKELEVANRELAGASQHKSEFLANMSHELRTPLNAIIGFSEVLTERMFGELNEKQDEYLKDIYASGQHLLSLINDILDLSKIEAGRMELELTDFHLPTALDNALTLVRERAGRRSITLQISVDERLGQIQADERKIRQVVLNLLSNAIKFTPEGGRIEIAAAPKDGFVEVSVSDTGVGIAPDDQEAVFEEFRQVGTAEKKAEGTGLGLTLCRKFVELHGGRIWVKSQIGQGATFTFTLPLSR